MRPNQTRFGQWDEERGAAEEEERPVKRARNPAAPAEEEVADVVGEDISAPAEVPTPAGKPEQRSGGGGAFLPPRTLFPFTDLIVEQDNVRSATLVARDVASLARALCASSDDLSELWRLFAEGCSRRIGSSSTTAQVMLAVQAAVLHDPARTRKVCQSSAKSDYRLTDKELKLG